jgi:hypothetical protein
MINDPHCLGSTFRPLGVKRASQLRRAAMRRGLSRRRVARRGIGRRLAVPRRTSLAMRRAGATAPRELQASVGAPLTATSLLLLRACSSATGALETVRRSCVSTLRCEPSEATVAVREYQVSVVPQRTRSPQAAKNLLRWAYGPHRASRARTRFRVGTRRAVTEHHTSAAASAPGSLHFHRPSLTT